VISDETGSGSLVFGTSPSLTTPTIDTINWQLTQAASSNIVTLLNSQDALTAVTGNSTDQTLYTYTIPANTIQARKGFHIKFGLLNNNAVGLLIKITIGATTLYSTTSAASANNIQGDVYVTNKAGVQNAQNNISMIFDAGTILANNTGSTALAENFANAVTVKVTVNVAASNTYTPKFWMVDLIQ